jgi:hypothetical protein
MTSEPTTGTVKPHVKHEVGSLTRLRAVEPPFIPGLLVLELLHLGTRVRKLTTRADPDNLEVLEKLLLDAVVRTGGDQSRIGEYELAVLLPGHTEPVTTVVVAA